MTVLIAGAGIGGLTLALALHKRGIASRIFEAAQTLGPLGVGINVLPHAMRELDALGLQDELLEVGVRTQEIAFYNRFGQFIHSEPRGEYAGYDWPQISLHRAKLQAVLLRAVLERLGEDAVAFGHRLVFADQSGDGVMATFEVTGAGSRLDHASGEVLVGCDGIRSAVRSLVNPAPDPLRYSGITMWRGVTRSQPFLTGATMAYAGWLETGKVIAYPIEEPSRSDGLQLINWIVEFFVEPRDPSGDWSRPGELQDFLFACEEMQFDWLDIPALIRSTPAVYEYPMVDRDPLPYWTDGRITLLGDAAHPMYPRGSNGAGQAILDARVLADHLANEADVYVALHRYDDIRCPATSDVVLANRKNPPDAVLREVFQRTGDRPFDDIEAVISKRELEAMSLKYKQVAGFDPAKLRRVK
jgi:5-methylphenazine-1-carboxylate 1-monooxygenase